MKYVAIALALLFVSQAEAGRANHFRVTVLDVDCVILESDPEQYEGTARVRFSGGAQARMRFERGLSRDIYNVCRELQAAEGTRVGAIYNFDLSPAPGQPARVISGFTHFEHAHIVNGSTFMNRNVAVGPNELEEDFSRDLE